jgi:hypothetical protein
MSERIILTRAEFLDSVGDLTHTVTELTAGYDLSQLTWQPGAGERWSVLECLDHLAVFNGIYLDVMEQAISDARPGTDADVFRTGGFLSTKFTRMAEPPPKIKFPAPGKIRPRPTLNSENILPDFLQKMDRVAGLVRSTAGKDLNTVRFRNPIGPLLRFTVANGFLIIAAHARRHIWQAEQVVIDAEFPR